MNKKLYTTHINSYKDARQSLTTIAIELKKVKFDASLWNYYRNLDKLVRSLGALEVEYRSKHDNGRIQHTKDVLLKNINELEQIVFFLKLSQ